MIVARAEVDYRAPSLYQDCIIVATTLEKGRGRLLEFSYRATYQLRVLVAEGRIRHLVLDGPRRLVSLPDHYQQIINRDDL